MYQKNKDIQNRYEGFLQTPNLWKNNAVYHLPQFEIENSSSKIDIDIDEKLRLGKYIERFVSYQLAQQNNVTILCENVQIQKEKRTLGELDCILKKGKSVIHLEIIYKFYLIDETVGKTEIEHCIGPNRKDSLKEKLTKLKKKQLPLLYAAECREFLKSLHLNSESMEQKVCFKAQLFVPFSNRKIQFTTLNNHCISGFYINLKQLSNFIDCKFYIPDKKDWLVVPHTHVDWLNFDRFQENMKEYLNRKFSPLCWLKFKNGTIEKVFLVWWD
ncbi:DUF1853 family protein [Polaribacter sp.]|uniref:DUF1853 family protein n=1 Tax=Polaribacter sp. TaxID=1920175 RepID=UPI003F6BF5CD